MKIIIFFHLILFASFTPAKSPDTINCLKSHTQKRFKTLCSNIIDPMKFKRGEVDKLNCLGPLGDGYEIGICEFVSIKEQVRMKSLKN